ncbi:helix-turn-helix domain-containing protein [Campylobacter coli]|uniref:Helix-turn-helix transcriptional regulator n=1 Tax=Campylobacter coli TaxID=195 RepID=A0A825GDY3_CAMCO|nr:AraC family transcriptional regulator [Campylobacter coli]EAC1596362.1 AraC family transcriptional regulator [Campylobacter coli]EAH7140603.1 AraC family transcriptional regulator [Campylobacter coli]EAH7145961.1 AraC family transcriptional regulator [Campylobacter coli]EAJ1076479.1 helix-turn-helix transcriptional regulator [Campylobacter coli]EAJ5395792.1 helix-turn-helix transcriptional regulator [Campylobacter coli]
MEQILSLPQDLKQLKGVDYKNFKSCTFAKYTQVSASHSSFVNVGSHLLTFVRKGYKILHTASKDYKIDSYETLFLKAGNYTLSNVGLSSGVYEAYLFFFDNAFLIELIYKYKDLFKLEQASEESEIFWVKNDKILQGILESFTPHFDENTQILDPIVSLKFEEIFLHLLLNKNTHFIGFLAGILKEFCLDLSQLFEYCGREFINVSEMAEFAKLDFATFSREFKKCFGQSPKKWLDEKRLQKAKVLLEFSKKNVNEIANECAFSSVAWFIERFKEKYNQTPKQYQKSKNLYFLSKN